MTSMNGAGGQLVKQCRVCGDIALGFNFNGLSCESCKAFFRRTALKPNLSNLRCRKNDDCTIEKWNRKQCKKCRLNKCIKIGMKKELILLHKENATQRRQRKATPMTHVDYDDDGDGDGDDEIDDNDDNGDGDDEDDDDDDLNYVHDNIDYNDYRHEPKQFPSSSASFSSSSSCSSNSLSSPPSFLSTHSSSAEMMIIAEDADADNSIVVYEQPKSNNPPSETIINPSLDVHHFPAYDLERLREVQNATAFFVDESKLEIVGEITDLIDAINVAEFYIEKVIKYCKKFSAFSCLNFADQITTLKTFYPQMMAIGASFLYQSHRNGIPVIMNQSEDKAYLVKLDFHTQICQKSFVTEFRQHLISMNRLMENDHQIRNLILAQLLFRPRHNDLRNPEYLRYNQRVYAHLLRRYLAVKHRHNVTRAERRYAALINMIERDVCGAVRILDHVIRHEIDSSKIATVLTEIYDLN